MDYFFIIINTTQHSVIITLFVTFDQPLYSKAYDIIANANLFEKSLVARLAQFHMLMFFFGCIGYIMGGSSIKEALSTIYAEKTVELVYTGFKRGKSELIVFFSWHW